MLGEFDIKRKASLSKSYKSRAMGIKGPFQDRVSLSTVTTVLPRVVHRNDILTVDPLLTPGIIDHVAYAGQCSVAMFLKHLGLSLPRRRQSEGDIIFLW